MLRSKYTMIRDTPSTYHCETHITAEKRDCETREISPPLMVDQARREGGCDGCARTPPPQTAEVHLFVKKINSKKK